MKIKSSKRYKKLLELSKGKKIEIFDEASKIIAGSARSMGIEVKE